MTASNEEETRDPAHDGGAEAEGGRTREGAAGTAASSDGDDGIGTSGVGTARGAGTAGTWDAEVPPTGGDSTDDEGDLGATDARANDESAM